MSTALPAHATMTLEEMLALPDNGMDRELIRGELRETPMTKRSRLHARSESQVAKILGNWLDGRPRPRGEIVSGEAGFRLHRNPDTSVGIDVAYVSAEVAARAPNAAYFEGPPVLAVEILSPFDRQKEIDEKVALYLESGVALVWLLNTSFRTVTVYRPGAPPELFNALQELTAEPHLPGFRVPVAQLFED